jgi:cyclopropane fatty-acyl-phospholipid synthase-like methyltransferase
MSFQTRLTAQFRNPAGALGHLAGWIMANRPSNIRRNEWLVENARTIEHSKVLELGCGPGVGLALLLKAAPQGHVTGIDQSSVMLNQASRRNSASIEAGRLELRQLELGAIEHLNSRFDRVLSANVLHFFSTAERLSLLRKLHPMLLDGGLLATAYQPRHHGASARDAKAFAEQHAFELESAGFLQIARKTLDLEPVPVVCVMGVARH